MNNTQRIKFIVPFLILFALLFLLWHELFYAQPKQSPTSLIGEKLPSFSLTMLSLTHEKFTHKELQGRITLLNVWATWCYACLLEHPMLIKISREYHIPIYSINYRDNREAARQWLFENGDPFVMTGFDRNGDVAIDLGIYGTPETFVISPSGKILYRHVGALDQTAWDDVLYPLIKQYQ